MISSQSNEDKIIIKCENCGQKIRVPRLNQRIRINCPTCKHEFDYPNVEHSQDDVVEIKLEDVNVCPICKKNDQLLKVESIVEHGTQELSGTSEAYVSDNYGGHWTTVPVTGTQISNLARKLARPTQPTQLPFGAYLIWGLFVPFGVMFGITIFGLSSQLFKSDLFSILNCAIPIMIIIIFLFRVFASKAKYEVDMPKWNKAIQVWGRLYYCFRDNRIYDPKTRQTFELSHLREYVYDPNIQKN